MPEKKGKGHENQARGSFIDTGAGAFSELDRRELTAMGRFASRAKEELLSVANVFYKLDRQEFGRFYLNSPGVDSGLQKYFFSWCEKLLQGDGAASLNLIGSMIGSERKKDFMKCLKQLKVFITRNY